MKDKINEILQIAQEEKPDEWRFGQAVFNYTYQEFPDAADKIRGTEYDCFYDDSKIPKFIKKLMKLLGHD